MGDIFIIVLFSTESAEQKIQSTLDRYMGLKSELHVSVTLTNDDRAFQPDSIGFWKDAQQRDQAKAMCIRLGSGLYKDPLGYGSQSLLIAFPDTCPNNCLPVIFASRSGDKPWTALLHRPTS